MRAWLTKPIIRRDVAAIATLILLACAGSRLPSCVREVFGTGQTSVEEVGRDAH